VESNCRSSECGRQPAASRTTGSVYYLTLRQTDHATERRQCYFSHRLRCQYATLRTSPRLHANACKMDNGYRLQRQICRDTRFQQHIRGQGQGPGILEATPSQINETTISYFAESNTLSKRRDNLQKKLLRQVEVTTGQVESGYIMKSNLM